MKTLYLIRGASGSGKTTLAKLIAGHNQEHHPVLHVEADAYFTNGAGEYHFERSKLKEAHHWCLSKAGSAMLTHETVIVSNTFTQDWEMQPYKDLAKDCGYTVFEIICNNDFGDTHGVPEDVKVRHRKQLMESFSKPLLEESAVVGYFDAVEQCATSSALARDFVLAHIENELKFLERTLPNATTAYNALGLEKYEQKMQEIAKRIFEKVEDQRESMRKNYGPI